MSGQSAEKDAGMCRCGHMAHDAICTVRTQYGMCWCRRGLYRDTSVTPSEKSRPCQGRNSNVCVAEGCYGESCVTPPAASDAPTT